MIAIHREELPLLGPVTLAATPVGICLVSLDDPEQARRRLELRIPGQTIVPAAAPCAEAIRQLREYLAGNRTQFTLSLDPMGTPFQRRVWDAIAAVPYGCTASYAQIAAAIGRRTAVRAVGAAVGANPLCILVPCHRIIGSNGSLTGYGYGLALKEELLSREARVAGELAVAQQTNKR